MKIVGLVMNDLTIITEQPQIFDGLNLPPQMSIVQDDIKKIASDAILEPKRGKVIYKYGRPAKYDKKTAKTVYKLLKAGKSIRTVAKELNMSTATVQKLKKTVSDSCKLSEVFGASGQVKK